MRFQLIYYYEFIEHIYDVSSFDKQLFQSRKCRKSPYHIRHSCFTRICRANSAVVTTAARTVQPSNLHSLMTKNTVTKESKLSQSLVGSAESWISMRNSTTLPSRNGHLRDSSWTVIITVVINFSNLDFCCEWAIFFLIISTHTEFHGYIS